MAFWLAFAVQPPHFLNDFSAPDLDAAGSKPGIIDYLQGEQERVAMASDPVTHKTILKDPVDRLSAIAVSRDPTVDDLVQSLSITDEEAELI